MRKLIVLIVAFAAASVGAATAASCGRSVPSGPGVQWRTDVSAAAAEAEESGRPLFLNFTADWCPPCILMEENTWADPGVQAALNDRFTPVKVDIDANPEAAIEHAAYSIPTLVIFEGSEPADRVTGYRSPDELVELLAGRGANATTAAGVD